MIRPPSFTAIVALPLVLAVSEARAEAPTATATCERVAGPGRVKCDVDLTAAAGATVRWADVMIVETPAFVTALKGRIGPADATTRSKDRWHFSFGLVARARGTGDVKLQVRAVLCPGADANPPAPSACEAVLVPLVATVVSGT